MLRGRTQGDAMTTAYDFSYHDADGEAHALAQWRGQPLLLVNIGSRCSFTQQYTGLQALWRQYRERGLVVIGFPCNHFSSQEPAGDDTIKVFCALEYGVDFPLSRKIEVNGAGADPLWRWLKRERRGLLGSAVVKWNFTKFLVDRQGAVAARFSPLTAPQALAKRIEHVLR
jgi:glutathione peroxidase